MMRPERERPGEGATPTPGAGAPDRGAGQDPLSLAGWLG
jgi:hypothetical protein